MRVFLLLLALVALPVVNAGAQQHHNRSEHAARGNRYGHDRDGDHNKCKSDSRRNDDRPRGSNARSDDDSGSWFERMIRWALSRADDNRNDEGGRRGRNRDRNNCGEPPPPPAPPPVPPPPAPPPPPPPPGGVGIDGTFNNSVDFSPLSGWTVEVISDAGNRSSMQTDASGRYAFVGLPAGTYTVCADIPLGWTQEMPLSSAPCLNGLGYSFPLVEGEQASWVNFLMRQQ